MKQAFSGYKTYIIGALLILAGALDNWDYEMILEGIGFITLRAGVSKMNKIE